jgi:hypothetical protein
MDTEIVQFMEQAGPYMTAAIGAYGGAVLSRAEDAAVDATANLGRRMLRAVWHRRTGQRAELERVVQEVAEDPNDTDAVGSLRNQIKRAVREDADLLRELADLLAAAPPGSVMAFGRAAVATGKADTAVSGDGNVTIYHGPAEMPWPIRGDVIAPEGCQGWIDSPQDRETVNRSIAIRGHVTAVPRDRQLWIVVRADQGGLFWPKDPPVTPDPAGEFHLTIHEGGTSSQVYISLILASQEASNYFADWMRKCSATGHYPGYPQPPQPLSSRVRESTLTLPFADGAG